MPDPTSPLTAVVVDDERLARRELLRLLGDHPDVEVVGEADSAMAARTVIAAQRPAVLFLDIQMPGETGFDLLDGLDEPPRVIFVTAYDRFALRAFEVNALDYLLKPVHPERLAEALRRVREQAAPGPSAAEGENLPPLTLDDRLFVTAGNRSGFVPVEAIVAIEAEGDYSRLTTRRGRRYLLLKSMKEWERRLPSQQFVRIHRSTIVNVADIAEMERESGQGYRVRVRHLDYPLAVSRRYAARLRERWR